MKYTTGILTASLAAAILTFGLVGIAGADSKPKYTIKQIMKDGLKGGLAKKVIEGKATSQEKIQLLDYTIALYETKPKKGDPAGWTKLTGDLVAAAAKVAIDPKASTEALGKAVNCKACHNKHKYDKPR
jgi:cytochrome c553